ncbi:MAG: AEC family transporter [Planctomycetota bacterium]
MLAILNILGPILLMAGLGALLQRAFKLSLDTLVKLNLYLFVPAFIFQRVGTSNIDWSEMGWIMGLTCVTGVGLGAIVGLLARLGGASRPTVAAMMLATCIYNSGNYGVPLAELAYGTEGGAAQTFVLFTQNILTFTVGMFLAGSGTMSPKAVLKRLFRMPIPYAVFAGVALRFVGAEKMPAILDSSATYLANGLVPVALVTLGAQLGKNPRWPRWKPVLVVCGARLIIGPLFMMGLIRLTPTELYPLPGDVLVLTAGVPCAINILLLTIELEGDADLAADCVFWSTVFSAVSVAVWIAILE